VNEITASGNTVEEAVDSALKQLNTRKAQVEVTVIDEGKKGFLGVFGSKPAVVKVKKKPDPISTGKKYIQDIANNMNVDVDIEAKADGKTISYHFQGEQLAILIGKRGQTLNALQYLAGLAINKNHDEYYTVMTDAENYRSRRKESVEGLALKMADRAVRTHKKVVLDPMPAFERKIVHHILQTRHDVTTQSQGKDPRRSIVIHPVSK
jgi:spoIIIJ-associated protein